MKKEISHQTEGKVAESYQFHAVRSYSFKLPCDIAMKETTV